MKRDHIPFVRNNTGDVLRRLGTAAWLVMCYEGRTNARRHFVGTNQSIDRSIYLVKMPQFRILEASGSFPGSEFFDWGFSYVFSVPCFELRENNFLNEVSSSYTSWEYLPSVRLISQYGIPSSRNLASLWLSVRPASDCQTGPISALLNPHHLAMHFLIVLSFDLVQTIGLLHSPANWHRNLPTGYYFISSFPYPVWTGSFHWSRKLLSAFIWNFKL